MVRANLVQQRFKLSDPQAKDMHYISTSMRRSARVEPTSLLLAVTYGHDRAADQTRIRRLLMVSHYADQDERTSMGPIN